MDYDNRIKPSMEESRLEEILEVIASGSKQCVVSIPRVRLETRDAVTIDSDSDGEL